MADLTKAARELAEMEATIDEMVTVYREHSVGEDRTRTIATLGVLINRRVQPNKRGMALAIAVAKLSEVRRG